MKSQKGYSLLELLTVLAILAIIATIAYSNYSRHVVRAACDSGKAGLIQAEAAINQLYIKYGVYNNSEVGEKEGSFKPIPSIPLDGSKNVDFNITFKATENTYTLTATPAAGGRLGSLGGVLSVNEKNERKSNLGGVNVWEKGCEAL